MEFNQKENNKILSNAPLKLADSEDSHFKKADPSDSHFTHVDPCVVCVYGGGGGRMLILE